MASLPIGPILPPDPTVAPTPLTPAQIETTFQAITQSALGIDNTGDNADVAAKAVRIGWQPEGQPFSTQGEDVVYLRCIEDDDQYNRVRDVEDQFWDDVSLKQVTSYTRVWRVIWILYGPNAFDRARVLKSALFRPSDEITNLLVTNRLYLVTDVAAPLRIPVPVPPGIWVERVDLEAQFNESVVEEQITASVASAEVIVFTDRSATAVADIDLEGDASGYGLGLYGSGAYGR